MPALSKGKYHISRFRELCEDRKPIEEWWQIISEFVLPRKSFVTETEDFVDDSRYRRLYDTTGVDACATLANGHSSYITPGDQRWFYWSAPDHIYTDESESWYRECSEIAALELASSNFYTQIDEGYLDRSGFGLMNLSCWPGKRTTLNVKVEPINSYCIEENDEGYVDVMYRCLEMGVRQIQQQFGDEPIQRIEKLGKSWQKLLEKGVNQKHKIYHCVYPRDYKERTEGNAAGTSREGRHMPIASVWVVEDGSEVIHEGGFPEMPYCVSRFLKHTGRGNQYGYSPSWRAMPTISQLNFLQKAMDFLAEVQANPRLLIPDYLEGDVDLRSGGATMFRANKVKGAYALPQEWASSGRYDVGVDRVESKKAEINRAFHVDLFRMFADLDRPQMTATEVTERAGEKMVQFSPSFTRFVADFQIFMRRAFAILLRAGRFPPPPESAIQQNPVTGSLMIEDPKIVYQSKIALALQQLQNGGIDRLLQRVAPLVEAGRMDVLDNLNLDAMVRTIGRNDGVPESVFSSEEVMAEIRERRQEQMEAEQQAAMMEQVAGAAGKAGLTAA